MTSLSIFMTSRREKLTLMLTKVFRSLASPRRWDLKNTGQAEANSLPFVRRNVLNDFPLVLNEFCRWYRRVSRASFYLSSLLIGRDQSRWINGEIPPGLDFLAVYFCRQNYDVHLWNQFLCKRVRH